MAHGLDIKNAVRHSYVTELLAMSVAAIKNSVSEGTARRWKMEAKDNGDDWELARTATRRSEGPMGEFTSDFIEEFTVQVNETFTMLKQENEGMSLEQRTKILSSLTDMMAKVMKHSGGNKKLQKRTFAFEVLKLLTKFISTQHPKLAPAFVDILTSFSARIDSEFDD
ncbi:DUF1804 family protein [Pseudoalteromonas denitrificans]|uniref:Uncharacterized protein n=1 Tax=Pseudoalteromonas denitrificans DSM 6059 TaxID=1123010 RepID=A0A1I1FZ95_9GAMM|nr:DUF1804 family protein [Pseudoalteromonas denitrificans]SFC04591.1 Protein of unknown function [Pseudoalteromonas denitrificans DSM 6059]